MQRVFANLLGKWVELTKGHFISNEDPKEFILDSSTPEYVVVIYDGIYYKIHKSQIQFIT